MASVEPPHPLSRIAWARVTEAGTLDARIMATAPGASWLMKALVEVGRGEGVGFISGQYLA